MSLPDDFALLHGLAAATPPPPTLLRDRILAAARSVSFSFLMRDEGMWLPAHEAPVAVKALFLDSQDRLATRLIRFLGAGPMPAAALPGRRSLYVIEGALASDDDACALVAGGYTDENPARGWRGGVGSLVMEFSQQAGGERRRHWQHAAAEPSVAAVPDGSVRPLAGTPGDACTFFVLSMHPNATLAEHAHHGVEELFVLAGSCEVEGRRLAAGDYHRAANHSSHAPTRTSDDGCDLLVGLRDPDRFEDLAHTV